MNQRHIVAVIVIIIAIGVVISTLVNSSTYADFSTAQKHSGSECQIIGMLNRHKPIGYNAMEKVNRFSFFMKDKEGSEMKVIYNGSKPQDFEKCDQVVISGYATDSVFYAKTLLLKCPSKYNDKKIPMTFNKKQFEAR
ncbi:MAG: cytochrome c maturation protein CcmE [Bacteroidota bacterium]|nr:cytochrome c maturation protein CcmE [Bacteroidota bacterium]